MNILHIIANSDPVSGGPIEALKNGASLMGRKGHQTEIVTLDLPSAPYLSTIPFPVHACGPGTRPYGYTPKLVGWIVANAARFDAAVVHGLWNHASVGGWQGLRRAGLPYVLFTHGMMDPWFKTAYPLKHWAKQLFWLAWQGRALRDAHRVLFTCEEERRVARGVFWGYRYCERVVAFGAAEPPGDLCRYRDGGRFDTPGLKGRRYILFLSRIHPKKGCDLLVEAFARVAAEYPDVDLVIAGPDQVGMKAQLQAAAARAGIADRLHWPGMLTGDRKWVAFAQADAFILPSHQENFGIVVAEAMACGTPVLITDKVNIWTEVMASGGGLVTTDTVEGIEQVLRLWLSLPVSEREKMRHLARAGFETHFHAEAAADDLISALEQARNRAQHEPS